MLGAYGPGDPRILGSTPFSCDLCMATGWAAEPCPFHAEKSWSEWLTDSVREWVWTIQRALRHATTSAPPATAVTDSPQGQH